MPFALVTIGLILIVTGAKDTYQQFGGELVGDFTGPDNFTFWLASMGAVGALGYIEALRPFSRAFLTLIIVAMILRNGGVFNKFQEALAAGPTHPAATNPPTDTSATSDVTTTPPRQPLFQGFPFLSPLSPLPGAINASPAQLQGMANQQDTIGSNFWSSFNNLLSNLGLRSTPAY